MLQLLAQTERFNIRSLVQKRWFSLNLSLYLQYVSIERLRFR